MKIASRYGALDARLSVETQALKEDRGMTTGAD
jgi:hypothetical protein